MPVGRYAARRVSRKADAFGSSSCEAGVGRTVAVLEAGSEAQMIRDLLIAAVIIVIAVVLGIAVHPLLLLLLIVAAIWLFGRHRAW
jgi:hypothetical protein